MVPDIETIIRRVWNDVKSSKSNEVPEYTSFKTRLLLRNNRPDGNSATKIKANVLCCIGNTPIVKLNNIRKHYSLKPNILGKLEYMSAGGSIKDRISRRMIEDKEERGWLKPGDIIVEATSGNTGVGLAMMCAVKGYKLVIMMPRKMSKEKEAILRAMGATVLRTRTEAKWNDWDSHIGCAYRFTKMLNERSTEFGGVHAHVMDQYSNTGNISAHYHETAVEILEQMSEFDSYIVVMGAGTGGTLTGVSLRLKSANPEIYIVGVDPEGSILHKQKWEKADIRKAYEVEVKQLTDGNRSGVLSTVVQRETVSDEAAFRSARDLIKYEGCLCGGSSGAALAGAIRVARDLTEKDTILVVLPDSTRNYMSKFVTDDWMVALGFMAPSAKWDANIDMQGKEWPEYSGVEIRDIRTVMATNSISDALKEAHDESYMRVIDEDAMTGLVSVEDMCGAILAGRQQEVVRDYQFKPWIIGGDIGIDDAANLLKSVDNATTSCAPALVRVKKLSGLHKFDEFSTKQFHEFARLKCDVEVIGRRDLARLLVP